MRLQHESKTAWTGWLRLLLAVSATCALGCAGTVPTCKVPSALELEIESSDRVNMDAEGRSLPTLVRVYQLSDSGALQTALFEDILERGKETLGPSLQAAEELTLYPGQVEVRHLERNPKADFIVGFAVFRKPIGASWRSLMELPLPGDPCQEQDNEHAAPQLKDLRVRMFLADYAIEAVNNYQSLPRRSCSGGGSCKKDAAADELPEERRHQRLRTFEEDPSRPRATATPSAAP